MRNNNTARRILPGQRDCISVDSAYDAGDRRIAAIGNGLDGDAHSGFEALRVARVGLFRRLQLGTFRDCECLDSCHRRGRAVPDRLHAFRPVQQCLKLGKEFFRLREA